MTEPYRLTPEQIRAIEATVAKGDRVEIVPVKDGLKLLRTRRNVINTSGTKSIERV